MEVFDSVECIDPSLGQRLVTLPIHTLAFEQAEKACGRGTVAPWPTAPTLPIRL